MDWDVVFGNVLVGGTILLVLAAVFIPIIGLGAKRAPSDYTGYVVDVEHNKGILFRTTQIHMKTHPRSSSSEVFCIHPSSMEQQLSKAKQVLRNRSLVRVEYRRPLFVPIWECRPQTSIVTNIEVMNGREDGQ